MNKTLGIMLLDEIDASLWRDNISYNIGKFDFLLIGCIGQKGKTIQSLESGNVIVLNVSDTIYSSKSTTDSSLRNILTEFVHYDKRFTEVGFILNIDSDERVIGNLPTWDQVAYPNGANCLYNYEYPFRNSRWLGCGGFFGRTNPRWLGDYHNAPSFIGSTVICDQFKIIHDRNTEQRRHHPVIDVMKYLSDDYYSRIAMIKNILDMKPISAEYKDYAVNSMATMPSIPSTITGDYLKMYKVQELMVRYKLSSVSGDLASSMKCANELINYSQRIGLIYIWMLLGRKDTDIIKLQYNAFNISNNPQFIDILDDSKLW